MKKKQSMSRLSERPTAPDPAVTAILAGGLPPVEDAGPGLTSADHPILGYPDRTLAEGAELFRWWQDRDRSGNYAERFDVMREYNPGNASFGFFDVAPVGGRDTRVMGIVQEMFYDRQKVATADVVSAQVKEFVLRYFMRVSHQRHYGPAGDPSAALSSALKRALSWLPEDAERRVGFGYEQLYYKRHGSGVVGEFPEDQRAAIVDLRDIGPVYDWIVVKVDIFDFNLSFAPFGAEALRFQVPMKEVAHLVIGPPFMTNVERPEPGVRARYGFGYAFMPYVPAPDMIAYGPGHFAAAIQTVDFSVMDDGEIRVRAAFVVNRPDKIAAMDIAPVDWGMRLADLMTFNLASKVMKPVLSAAGRLPLKISGLDPVSSYIWLLNTMTGGIAARDFGISKLSLERRMLVQHFVQHYEMLSHSLLAWRAIADWTDHERLPEHCRLGTRC